jgi:NlpC/P60 family putative phage cell wall peptidase
MLENSNSPEILGIASPSSSSEGEVLSDRTKKIQELVVSTARSWIGTPYHHQMAVKGAGCDCLGLVRGVYEEIYGKPAEPPPPYTRDWAEATGRETLLEASDRYLLPRRKSYLGHIKFYEIWPGDVLIFRMRRGALAKHAAIATSASTMIHAFEDNPVCEVPLTPWWHRKLAGVYSFPQPEILGDDSPSSSRPKADRIADILGDTPPSSSSEGEVPSDRVAEIPGDSLPSSSSAREAAHDRTN